MNDDPFVLPPEGWYAVLCNGFAMEPSGNVTLQGIFNQTRFLTPLQATGISPHGHLVGLLAIGLTGGQGRFHATINVQDLDGRVYWERPEGDWEFDVGIGSQPSVVFAQQLSVFLPTAGHYHFAVRVTPGPLQFRIPFEVAERIGPARAAPQPGPT